MRTSTVYRFTVSKFNRLAATGVFDDDRVELLGGVPTMMTTCPPHDYAVTRFGDFLEDCLSRERWTVREEKPIRLGRFWQPLPDIVVVRGAAKDFSTRTPEVLDIALLVEVSDTTYAKDAGKKLRPTNAPAFRPTGSSIWSAAASRSVKWDHTGWPSRPSIKRRILFPWFSKGRNAAGSLWQTC